jgi:hypothetical protein
MLIITRFMTTVSLFIGFESKAALTNLSGRNQSFSLLLVDTDQSEMLVLHKWEHIIARPLKKIFA